MERLQQVFFNIYTNAQKFTEKGTISITISKQLNKRIEVSIKDTGVGISKQDQNKLFQLFGIVKSINNNS